MIYQKFLRRLLRRLLKPKTTKQFKQRNDQVALFLADQRMPRMDSTEFLLETKKIYPDAYKVLLTAYPDTEAEIESINDIGLDYYLMKS